jgi:tetratricopeptide (TPR) repeat protein
LDFLDSVSGKTLEYLRDAPGDELSPNGLTLRAKGLQIIGEVSRARGESALAVDALNRSNLILMRQHQLAPRDIQVLKNLGANAYWVGQIHKDQNNWTGAGEAWRQYLVFSDLLHQLEPDNPEWWIEQSYAHNNLGNLADARGMPAQAVPEFEKSIALKQAALERSPGSHALTGELADSYSWLASAKESLGDLRTAQDYYAIEMQLVLRLRAQYPADAKWIYYQMGALRHRALIGMALGRDAEALRDFNEAARLFAPITRQDPNNRTWQLELATLEQERLFLLTRSAPMATLLPDLMNVHRTMQALLAEDPKNAQWTRSEAVARTRVAAALLAAGKMPAAEQEATQAIASLNRLYAGDRADLTGRLALVESLLLLSTVQQNQNNNSSSVMTCKQAHALIENDSASSRSYQVLAPWIRVNACLRQLDAAQAAVKWLEQIGYRDHSYVQFISTL